MLIFSFRMRRVCTSFCAGKGFEWAGIEYGRECYVSCKCFSPQDLQLRYSVDSVVLASTTAAAMLPFQVNLILPFLVSPNFDMRFMPASTCSSECAGNVNEDCGGHSALTLYRNPTKATAAPNLPAGWSSAGCVADNVNGARTLSGYTFARPNMTLEYCVNTCNDRKYTYAGVEYGSECYCSNTPSVSTGLQHAALIAGRADFPYLNAADFASKYFMQYGMQWRCKVHLRWT